MEEVFSVGPIMKAARKFKNLNQADVASAIGCSQSALSKMEHNLLVPSAPQWFLFARFTAIPPESLETGVIDRHTPISYDSTETLTDFKIPKRYRQNRALKIREIYPFLKFFEMESISLVKEFINETDLAPEFFLDFDNLVNFNMMTDVLTFLQKQKKNTPIHLKKIVEIGQNDIYWERFAIEWKKLGSVYELLEEFVRAQQYFQMDFIFKLERNEGIISLTYFPEYHLRRMSGEYSDELTSMLNLYRKYTLENLIKRELEEERECVLVKRAHEKPLEARFELRDKIYNS